MVTFLEKLQAHVGGLVRINTLSKRKLWSAVGDKIDLNGKVGIVYSSNLAEQGVITFFIDGSVRTVHIYASEIEFLEGPQ